MVIIRHSSRRALQSIYTSKNIIANYGNYCNKRIFNTDLCLSQTERSEGEKGMIVKMTNIPQCMHCKNGKIENGIIICKKYQVVPEKIANGIDICKYHENTKK